RLAECNAKGLYSGKTCYFSPRKAKSGSSIQSPQVVDSAGTSCVPATMAGFAVGSQPAWPYDIACEYQAFVCRKDDGRARSGGYTCHYAGAGGDCVVYATSGPGGTRFRTRMVVGARPC